MNTIKNNPYRTVGLLVGATAREQQRQINRLIQFIQAEQEPQADFSFPVLGEVERTVKSVNDAASQLNLDSDKMHAALFWFFIGNSITDEPALEALKDADKQNTIDTWSKLTATGNLTQRNSSAYHNLSTLLLCSAFDGSTIDKVLLEQSISLKLKFLDSEFVKDLKSLATDDTYETSNKDLQLMFLNQVQSEITKKGGINSNGFLEIVNKHEFLAKADFLKGFVAQPIAEIEKQIEISKTKRKAKKEEVVVAGTDLFEKTRTNHNLLKSILGTSDLKFISISDKVSDEILQCGIQLFNDFKDHETYDPGKSAMDLFLKAKSLAIGNISKQRIQENIEGLQGWINEKPEREKQKKIINDFESLRSLIDQYENINGTISSGKQLLSSAIPYLNNIKNTLGGNDELYLGISSRIASDALSMCVSEINKLQDRVSATYDNATKRVALLILKERIGEALNITNTILSMDLRQDFRSRCVTNRNTLSGINSQLSQINRPTGGGSSGCYIATMAYGDYDHPQVLILRQFRDDVLNKSFLGRWFIKFYYLISPKLVELLKNQIAINASIRIILNQFIKFIK